MSRRKKEPKQEFYSLEPILKEKAYYNITVGEHLKGRTYGVLKYTKALSMAKER